MYFFSKGIAHKFDAFLNQEVFILAQKKWIIWLANSVQIHCNLSQFFFIETVVNKNRAEKQFIRVWLFLHIAHLNETQRLSFSLFFWLFVGVFFSFCDSNPCNLGFLNFGNLLVGTVFGLLNNFANFSLVD